VALTHKEVFERYVYAGAITQNPDAIAAMFTEDGVYEAPLVPDGHPLRRMVGQDAIRTGTDLYHQQPIYQATMNVERSAYVLHDTPDPDVFIAEIDVAFHEADGRRTTMSLVQISRLRDGQITMLRDYFAELPSVVPTALRSDPQVTWRASTSARRPATGRRVTRRDTATVDPPSAPFRSTTGCVTPSGTAPRSPCTDQTRHGECGGRPGSRPA
jgi:uncharacterized protein